jgi:hypothetical protein
MFVLDSNVKGDVAELEVALAATRLGIPVLRPMGDHARFDLAFEVSGQILKVQCKSGRLSAARDTVIAQVSTNSLTSAGTRRSVYAPGEIDLFGIYCAELDRCFLLGADVVAGQHVIYLRLVPARNQQRACINLAANFEFPGAIAQLGGRLAGSQKVAGSSPASSIATDCTPTVVGCNPFRDRFGEWIERVGAGEEVIVTRRGKPLLRLLRV